MKAEFLPILKIKKAASVIRSINNEFRWEILKLLNQGEYNVTEIYVRLKCPQEVASIHLQILRKYGVVKTRRDGKNIFYAIDKDKMNEILSIVDKLDALPEQPKRAKSK
jgi:DNA-binding transcriptional ArsR family regulator